jgi:hypothetical protein
MLFAGKRDEMRSSLRTVGRMAGQPDAVSYAHPSEPAVVNMNLDLFVRARFRLVVLGARTNPFGFWQRHAVRVPIKR